MQRATIVGFSVLVLIYGLTCTSHISLSVEDQRAIQSTCLDNVLFLKQSFFVGPFFAYDDRLYISERAFDEQILLETPDKKPVLLSTPIRILPMGTKMRISSIEFPTQHAIAQRKLKSPRYFTWVMLEEAEHSEEINPYVLVLTQQFTCKKNFEHVLSDFLVDKDPRKEFATMGSEIMRAIDEKTVIKGMPTHALLRSRGWPDQIKRETIDSIKVEYWQYAPGRVVILRDNKVDSWAGF